MSDFDFEYENKPCRVAMIYLEVLHPRCRKPKKVYVEGVGKDDKEATDNLIKNVEKEVKYAKSYEINKAIEIIDAEMTLYKSGISIIRRPAFFRDERYNYKQSTFDKGLISQIKHK